MKSTFVALMSLSVLTLAAASPLMNDRPDELLRLEFKNGVGRWQVVLDGVMGGLSTGMVSQSRDGFLRFRGALSLENNGGFSQIRRPVDGNEFPSADGIEVTFRGDGRTYTFDVRTSNARLMAGGFQREFVTEKGEWNTLRLPFEDFRLYSFGRPVVDAPDLDASRIESIGITVADKKPGDFEIVIKSILAYDTDRPYAAEVGTVALDETSDPNLRAVLRKLGLDRQQPSQANVSSSERSIEATDRNDVSRRAQMNADTAAARLCELAVSRGVPLFNNGQQAACASIYEVAISAMIELGENNLDAAVVEQLRHALQTAHGQHDWVDRAWTYREAIDAAYAHFTR